jgi:hypothetical protein
MDVVGLIDNSHKNTLLTLLTKLKVIVLVNFLTLIVIFMTYKPPKLTALDSSDYIYLEFGKNLLLLVCSFSLLLYVAKKFVQPRKFWIFRFKFLWLPISIFCGFIAVSGLWNRSPIFSEASVGVALFNLVQFVTVCILFYFVGPRRRVQYLAMFLGNLSFVLALFVIPEVSSLPLGTRLVSLAGDSTAFGSFSALGVLSISYLSSIRKKKPFLMSAMQVIFLFTTVLSGSRNALLSLCLAYVVYFFVSGKAKFNARFNFTSIIKTFFFSLAALPVTMVVATNGASALFSRGDSIESSRTFIWSVVCSLYVESSIFNKVFGNGFGFLKDTFRSAHSTYIQILIEYGAIFLILLLCYLCYLFKCILVYEAPIPSKSEKAYLMSLLVFIFVFSFSLNVLFVGVFSICYLVLCSITAILILNMDGSSRGNSQPEKAR